MIIVKSSTGGKGRKLHSSRSKRDLILSSCCWCRCKRVLPGLCSDMQHACVPLVLVKSLTACYPYGKMQKPSHQLEDTLLTLQLLLSFVQNIHTSIHPPANLCGVLLINYHVCTVFVCAVEESSFDSSL